jgi:hypothetical protein
MEYMKTKWQYNHIIDLEYFSHQDAEKDRTELHQRDRNIFLRHQDQLDNKSEPANHDLIRLWLSERKEKDFPGPEKKSPGTIFGDVYLLAQNLAAIKGIFVGLVAGFTFFTYTGTTPVNVFNFLLLFVFSQLFFVGLLIAAWLLRPLLPKLKLPSFYSFLFRGILTRLISFFHKKWLQKMDAGQRVSVSHAFGIFRARSSVYGFLFYWPLFILSQLFAIGFNIGLLAATLLKISTSDLAFGWQSTMQFSVEAIHRAVMLAALPWSWFVSLENSYPSLAEIEGSRIILKEGIYHLTTGDLIAWWPFLVFCLLFYGLFVRLALFITGRILERTSLGKLKFDTPAFLALVRRMKTPLVSTQAAPEQREKETENLNEYRQHPSPPSPSHLVPQTVLIPDDIYALCPREKLETRLQDRSLTIKDAHRFLASYDEDRQLLQFLADKKWEPEEGIFILMEGWMVPLVDFLSYLKELRKILPDNAIIFLGLVGRPDKTVFTPVAAEDFTIWRKKIESMGDPYLTVFSLTSDSKVI